MKYQGVAKEFSFYNQAVKLKKAILQAKGEGRAKEVLIDFYGRDKMHVMVNNQVHYIHVPTVVLRKMEKASRILLQALTEVE